MNKIIRFVLILALLVGVVVVAGSKTAWASPAPSSPVEKANPAPVAVSANVGTVNVPGTGKAGVHVVGTADCPISIWGIATLCPLSSNTDVLASLDPRPDGYLSKIVELKFSSGSARLCFASVNGNEVIYFNIDDVWTRLYTFYMDGQACVDVSSSGQYVLGN